MSHFTLLRDDAVLQGFDSETGDLAVVFQHGLGGGFSQVVENFPDSPSLRRLTLECRAQGGSTTGSARPYSFALFADDILAACDARGIDRFVAGGISMGAALALRIAVRHPERVDALILARPAWTFYPSPPNMQPYAEVAKALRALPPAEAKRHFSAGHTAAMLAREAPDNLASLLGFFDRPDPAATADLLGAIAADGPDVTRANVEALQLPTLVIGHGVDYAHPLDFAREMAGAIVGARLVEIPPKATHKAQHVAAFRQAVVTFVADLASQRAGRLDLQSPGFQLEEGRCVSS